MTRSTRVTVWFGPLSWFQERLGDTPRESLLELAFERDEASRRLRVVVPGQYDDDGDGAGEDVDGPDVVVAESGDYASLSEHVITNFAGLVGAIRPGQLHLHNPPAQVHAQMKRAFGAGVERYSYPHVTLGTLAAVRDGFAGRLVGQAQVKERLLAALYPLTRPGRTRPVVLMFYGPSGVGKTETAHFVNGLLGGTLLRKQFSMFHSDKFASYLFGGKHSEPSFAHDLLDRESGVILIDEFDKANPVFYSAFYQLFDGGEFEDKNYKVEVGPSLVVCTSNYRSETDVRDAVGDALYSRFDAVIGFNDLSPDEVLHVIDRLVAARFAGLSEQERACLDQEQVTGLLRGLAASRNVRQLGKTVDELVSLMLIRSLLAPAAPPAAKSAREA
ncbi:MAG: peptidase [Solirubrobacterales bacterium]|jgi:ATP-dependent Clp protease ATP-binding subunit ClpA|nr:peptidase [Solirubrobacterales bacterium]